MCEITAGFLKRRERPSESSSANGPLGRGEYRIAEVAEPSTAVFADLRFSAVCPAFQQLGCARVIPRFPSLSSCVELYIDVFVALNLRKALAQLVDVGSNRYGKNRFELKNRCAAYRRRIGFGLHRFDIDAQGG